MVPQFKMKFYSYIIGILCSLWCSTTETNGYKILGVFPLAAPSHYFLGSELMKGLAEAGHNVTILTVFTEKNVPKNGSYRQIVLEEVAESQKGIFTNMANLLTQNFFPNPFLLPAKLYIMGSAVAEELLSNAKTQELIKSNEKFDAVIIPQFAVESAKALAPHFGAHQIILNNNAANSYMNHFVGNPDIPSVNAPVVLGYNGEMNLQQRLMSILIRITDFLFMNLLIYPTHASLVHKYISKDLDLHQILYNVSLVLSNSDSSLNTPYSAVPCMKEIGGYHVRPPKKLPEDLQKYMDNAKDGIIYFSMGSNLKGSDLPIEKRNALMEAFAKRKEKILWKFESDDLPGKPDNVRIEKWLPQSDILAHPNIKVFITHGGFLSTTETVYHGIPTIAIPIFGDQLKNAMASATYGYSIVLNFYTMTEETISEAMEEIISNKKYRDNAKYRSKIFHDRPVKPLDEAVYWIEYVIRHNGAPFLRVDYLGLTWYQYYMLDVLAIIVSVILTILFITKKLVKVLCWLCRKKETKSTKYKKDKVKKR